MDQNVDIAGIEEFWLDKLATPLNHFGFLHKHSPSSESNASQTLNVSLKDSIDIEKLLQVCQEDELNIFTYFLCAIHIVMNRYTNEEDFLVGTSSFQLEEDDAANGLLLFKNVAELNVPFKQLLKSTLEEVEEAYDHQENSYDGIAEKLKIRQQVELSSYLNVAFLIEGVNEMTENIDQFDLVITLSENYDQFTASFKELEVTKVEAFLKHVAHIAGQVTKDLSQSVNTLSLANESEIYQILNEFNGAINEIENETVAERFQKMVTKYPDHIAAQFGSTKLTYQQLDQYSNDVAHYFIEHCQVQPNDMIGIMIPPSDQLIIGMLGIIKSGAAFVPIDPENPQDRIEFILQDSNPKGIIVESDSMFSLGDYQGHIFAIDIQLDMLEASSEAPQISTGINDALYVIYTSGTTGKPKGTIINQRSFLNYIQWLTKTYDLNEKDSSVLLSSYAFDLGYTCLWGALLNGGNIHLVGNELRKNPDDLIEYLSEQQITFLKTTPSLFGMMVSASNLNKLKDAPMSLILLGGEEFRIEDVEHYRSVNSDTTFVNHYGPTETTIGTIAHTIENEGQWDGFKKNPVIGVPIENAQIYILDHYGNLVPKGVSGQIFVAGNGLSKGYLNRPELSAEKFLDNPFIEGSQYYGTGDLGVWTELGTIQFLGRADDQVKIRGYRVETGEVTVAMNSHDQITDSVTIAIDSSAGGKELAAYFVSDSNDLGVGELREFLTPLLPEYMIPTYFVPVNSIPVTSNGKVDKKSLPDHTGALGSEVDFEGARNEREEILTEVWEDVLGRTSIGVNDNFFVLGGDSIKSVQIASRLLKYNLKMEVADIFDYSTIAELAPQLRESNIQIEQSAVSGIVPLTPIQNWFFDSKFTEQHHFNQSVAVHFKTGISGEYLNQIFTKITEHHDVIRSRYSFESGQVKQEILKPEEGTFYTIHESDFTNVENVHDAIREKAVEIQSGIDLEHGPLLHIGYFKTEEGDHVLIVLHHLVVDGVSWRILLEDLKIAFGQLTNGEQISFQDKTSSFLKWANALKEYASSNTIVQEVAYWKGLEQKEISKLEKKSDKPSKLKDLKRVKVSLSKEETQRLLEKTNHAYNTEINDLLMSALSIGFNKWNGFENLLIRLEGHGRENISDEVDVTRTVGWFTSSYPVVLGYSQEGIGNHIKRTKEALRRIPNKGIGYEIIKYLTPDEHKQDCKFTLKPEVNFNYLGQFDGVVSNKKDGEKQEPAFGISGMPTGNSISPNSENNYALNITGMIASGKLSFDIGFATTDFDQEQIDVLADSFKSGMIEIIEHCSEKQEREKTPSDFADLTLDLADYQKIVSHVQSTVPDLNLEKVYALSAMQEGMLFHYLMDKSEDPYYRQLSFNLKGRLDVNLIQQCLDDLYKRHEVLRTLFVYENIPNPRQVILEGRTSPVQLHDISDQDSAFIDVLVDEHKTSDQQRGFELSEDSLFRINLVKISESEYELIWSYHHIIMDGWCLGIIISDFFEMYYSKLYERELDLPKTYPYSEYIKWYNRQDKLSAINYWRDYLKEYQTPSQVPMFKPEVVPDIKRGTYKFSLNEELTNKLKEFASLHQATLNTVFQAAWSVLLSKYNGSDDVAFGSIVSGRPTEIEGIEKMLGLFINAIPVRVKTGGDIPFNKLVKSIQEGALESGKYDFAPLVDIQANSELKQDLFDHIIIFVNYPLEQEVEESGNSKEDGLIQNVDVVEQTSYNFDIRVIPAKEFKVEFTYDPHLFTSKVFEGIKDHFTKIIREVTAVPDLLVDEIKLLTDEDELYLSADFNQSYFEYDNSKNIVQLFESSAEQHSDKTALSFEGVELTYKELNERVNKVASHLTSTGVGKGDLVGLMLERSERLVIGILAILKAGAAYLPIDPDYPTERINYMLHDSETSYLLLEKELDREVIYSGHEIQIEAGLNTEVTANPNVEIGLDALAYVIYTSGSTGKPKGVQLEHRNVTSFNANMEYRFGLSSTDTMLAITTVTFDISVLEIICSLLNGMTVELASTQSVNNPETLANKISSGSVTALQITPSRLQLLLDQSGTKVLEQLNVLLVGGEAMSQPLYESLIQLENIDIFNVYGPTEATIWSSTAQLKPGGLNIGQPLFNEQMYILDEASNLAPIGVQGELCIAGEGLARGYLNRPELTTERFITNPFNPAERLYKTGDLARWLPSGEIEFFGRKDDQVKLRGYRIELGEIDSEIREVKGVTDSITLIKEDASGQKVLCNYYTTDNQIEGNQIREYLNGKLPTYMVPTYFMLLDVFPLMSSGKVNRKALPEPSFELINIGSAIVEPSTSLEVELRKVWSKILYLPEHQISVTDNFFEIGGHSLKAMQLVSEVQRNLGMKLSVVDVFDFPSIKAMAENWNLVEASGDNENILQAGALDSYPVTYSQQRIYVLSQMAPNSTVYNMPGIFEVEGILDLDKFNYTIEKLIERHEPLRTSFFLDGDVLMQKVHSLENVNIQSEYREIAKEEVDRSLQTFVRPFDLEKDELFRVLILKVEDGKFILAFDMHHIISDGESVKNLFNDFVKIYSGAELEPLKVQIKDYASQFSKEKLVESQAYWLDKYADQIPVLELPTDFVRPKVKQFEGARCEIQLERDTSAKLKELITQNQVTPFMFFVGVYKILLSKYSGQRDLIIGSPISGRTNSDLLPLVGAFVNTLAIRTQIDYGSSFKQFLERLKAVLLQDYKYQDYPFDALVDELNLEREPSRNPLFDVMLMYAKFNDSGNRSSNGELKYGNYQYNTGNAKFDLSLDVVERDSDFTLRMDYSKSLFTEDTVMDYLNSLIAIIQQVINSPEIAIRDLQVITEEDRELQINELGKGTQVEIPQATLVELFEKQVEESPNDVAIESHDRKLTYSELNLKVNGLANNLINIDVQKGDLVGVLMDRSVEMVSALLAIQKAGAAYLPIDPDLPQERLDYVIQDSGIKHCVTNSILDAKLSQGINSVVVNDLENIDPLQGFDKVSLSSEDLAYVIYTSGSTGNPKGTLIQHKGVVNRILWMKEQYDISNEDVILQKTNYAFDVSVWEFFMTLIVGAKLVVCDKEAVYDPKLLVDTIERHKVTTLHFVPSMLDVFIDHLENSGVEEVQSIKQVFSSGEALKVDTVVRFHQLLNADLHNLYGPTEATVDVTHFATSKEDTVVPIGKPVWNTGLYVLDQDLNLLPTGAVGELHISGIQLAQGYLNRPDLTQEKFVQNPFDADSLVYKTGDLVRWSKSGELEYLGRKDTQVKIRGHRIELGEIEQVLEELANVDKAIVVFDSNQNGGELTAYAVATKEDLNGEELKSSLASKLPNYMVPSRFVSIPEVPLTLNGKLNYRALESIGTELIAQEKSIFEEAEGELEIKVRNIFARTLKVSPEEISVNSDFFELGGHSLKAMHLIGAIRKELKIELPILEFFKNATIRKTAEYLSHNAVASEFTYTRASEKEKYLASPGQRGFYLFQQKYAGSTLMNIPMMLPLGADVDLEKVEQIISTLIERHEALRTSFFEEEGDVYQKIIAPKDVRFELKHKKLEKADLNAFFSNYARSFDLGKAPLLRATMVETLSDQFYLIVDVSHLVFDGSSMNVIKDEFFTLWKNEELPAVEAQYRDFSEWQHQRFESGQFNKHEEFWLKHLAAPIKQLSIPTDFPRSQFGDYNGKRYVFRLGSKRTKKVNDMLRDQNVTLYMLLMANFNILLSKMSGEKEVAIGTSIAGRNHFQFERTVGLLLGTIILRNYPESHKSFDKFLNEVRTAALKSYEYQDYPFDLLMEQLEAEILPGRNAITDFGLMVQNMYEKDNMQFSSTDEAVMDFEHIKAVSKMDITLYAYESKDNIELAVEYKSGLFKEETIQSMFESFVHMMDQVVAAPTMSIGDIVLGKNDKQLHGLTHAQKRIFNIEQIVSNSGVNNTPFIMIYDYVVDFEILEKAIRHVINTNDGLRLRTIHMDHSLERYQYIEEETDWKFELADFSKDPEGYEKWLKELSCMPLYGEDQTLFLMKPVLLPEGRSGYYFNVHHLVGDGWTIFLVGHLVHVAYEAFLKGEVPNSETPSYLEYLKEEREYLASPEFDSDGKFWREYLFPLPEPMKRVIPSSTNGNDLVAKTIVTSVPDTLRSQLLQFIETNKSSIHRTMMAVLAVYLSKVEDRKEVVIGSVNHGRDSEKKRNTCGMYVSTVPVKAKLEDDESFLNLESKLAGDIKNILKNHSKYPFDLLTEDIRKLTGESPNYLLDLNLITHPDVREKRFEIRHAHPGADSSALTIHINASNRNINGLLELNWSYQTGVFDEERILEFHKGYMLVLEQCLANNGSAEIGKMSLLTEDERQLVVNGFNSNAVEFENIGSFVDEFQAHAKRTPDAIAVVFKEKALTYRQLDESSNQFANYLIEEFEVQKGEIVPILLNRSEQVLIASLAVLKTGAGYLPIDPKYPQDRVHFLLEDCDSKLSITEDSLKSLIGESKVVLIDDNGWQSCSDKQPPVKVNSEDLAYVIYTSGSTGNPKGVLNQHGSWVKLGRALVDQYNFNKENTVLQLASFAFDVFAQDMLRTLAVGGKMVICPDEHKLEPDELIKLAQSYSVSFIESTPGLIVPLMDYIYENEIDLPKLKMVVAGADAFPTAHYNRILERFGDKLRIINSYGVTECTIDNSHFESKELLSEKLNYVPIGKPLRNNKFYIVDSNLNPVPVGVFGELCVAGNSVGQGYYKRPELTAEKFVPSPFVEEERMYRTGDLARWLSDGNVEFIGRLDFQVKIRGYRIETGEIENAILNVDGVKQAAVKAFRDDSQELFICGYYSGAVSENEIKEALNKKLPDYMVPAVIVRMEKFTLSANAKIDRKQLPKPSLNLTLELKAASNLTEENLSSIWKEILHLEQVGVDQDFFELGGHSLKANVLANKIHKTFNVKVTLADIFSNSTIETLATKIRSLDQKNFENIKRLDKQEYYDVSYAQKRLWLLDKMHGKPSSLYNIYVSIELIGIIDVEILKMAFKQLIERHEVFRTKFVEKDHVPMQQVFDDVPFELDVVDLTDRKVDKDLLQEQIALSESHEFNLSEDFLYRFKLIRVSEKDNYLLINMHHIISDGWSMRVMFNELIQLYSTIKTGRSSDLKPLEISYKDYASWHNNLLVGEDGQQLKSYWGNKLGEKVARLKIPMDFERNSEASSEAGVKRFSFSEEQYNQIQELSKRHQVNTYAFMTSIFKVFFAKLTGQQEIVFGSTIAGRDHENLENQIGLFVNTFLLKDNIGLDESFLSVLKKVRNTILEAAEYGSYPFDKLVEVYEPAREGTRNPLFDVLLSMVTTNANQNEVNSGENQLDLKAGFMKRGRSTAKFDLTFNVFEGAELVYEIEYKIGLFKEESIDQMISSINQIIEEILANPKVTISQINVFSNLEESEFDEELDFGFDI